MQNFEKTKFVAELTAIAGIYGREISTTLLATYFDTLRDFALEEVFRALRAHVRNPSAGQFFPKPADVIREIEAEQNKADNRPSGNEAWTIAVTAQNENATVVWNEEIAEAWDIARCIEGDSQGARMAFRDAYERIVTANRAVKISPRWFASLGRDPAGREKPILEARRKNLIGSGIARAAISHNPTAVLELERIDAEISRKALRVVK